MSSVWGKVGGTNGSNLMRAPPSAAAVQLAQQQAQQRIQQRAIEVAAEEEAFRRNIPAYRACAVRATEDMLDIRERAGDKTLCCMFYVDEKKRLQYEFARSGGPSRHVEKQIKDIRESAGVPRDKPTFCAEEFLLAAHPEKPFLFAWAFNAEYENGGGTGQMIRACGAGCRAILKHRSIEDLAFTEASWGGSRRVSEPSRSPRAASAR